MEWTLSLALLVLIRASAASAAGTPARCTDDLLHALIGIETECGHFCSPADAGAIDTPALVGAIDHLSAELRPRLAGTHSPADKVAALNRFVFGHLGMRASGDLADPSNLILSRVLTTRRAYCVGLAALYLVLAERAGLPIHAVATPSHVFLRYDDGTTRINIETLRGGAQEPDAGYIEEQRITEEAVRRGIFLRNLTTPEFVAQVRNNLGVIYSRRRMYDRAAAEYREARALLPDFPAAWYNEANDLLLQGHASRAVRCFSRALRLHPLDPWALNYRGLAWLKRSRPGRARKDFEAALRIEPGFEAARRNLENLTRQPAGARQGEP